MNSSQNIKNIIILPEPDSISSFSPLKSQLYQLVFKRVFDLVLVLLSLPLAIPLLLILMAIIRLDSKGPSIYKSQRVGKNGQKYNCLKLRTMHVNAEEKLKDLLQSNDLLNQEYQKYRKLKIDPRITRVGKFLRAFSLDELPQIFNVLKNDMSFVGPRPAFEWELEKYGARSLLYKRALPGITGPWQVNGRSNISFEGRVAHDVSYIYQISFSKDLFMLFQTIPAVLSKKGAY